MSRSDAFTAGPWFPSGVRQKVGGADTHSVVATIDGKEIIIASVWYNPRTHEGFHDARLISAAPDLLAAAKEALDFISATFENLTTGEIEGDAGEPLAALYSAIAKAEGR